MQKASFILAFIYLVCGYAFAQEAELKNLGDYFKIYLTKEDRRGPEDGVTVIKNRGGTYTAEISYLRELTSRDVVDQLCDAYGWLLFGRGKYGKGAREAFERYPALFQINLKLYGIENGTRTGKKRAEILPVQKIEPYLRIGVTRNSFLKKKVDESLVKKKLDKDQCARVGRDYFDLFWVDDQYLKKAQSK